MTQKGQAKCLPLSAWMIGYLRWSAKLDLLVLGAFAKDFLSPSDSAFQCFVVAELIDGELAIDGFPERFAHGNRDGGSALLVPAGAGGGFSVGDAQVPGIGARGPLDKPQGLGEGLHFFDETVAIFLRGGEGLAFAAQLSVA